MLAGKGGRGCVVWWDQQDRKEGEGRGKVGGMESEGEREGEWRGKERRSKCGIIPSRQQSPNPSTATFGYPVVLR